MPELPEVQTIVGDLQKIIDDQFVDFFSNFPKAIKNNAALKFSKEIENQKIKAVLRLGKIILIQLSNKKFIAIHLKMTGQMLLNFKFEIFNLKSNLNLKILKQNSLKLKESYPHIHHVFFLKKYGVLAFSDVRKFATISLLSEKDILEIRKNYGLDPITDDFKVTDFENILKKRKNKPIKSILMDNSVILGIGNIYASEILFDANILPQRQGSSLSGKEIKKLHFSIKKILKRAILLRGTSVSDYRDSFGQKGAFQAELNVYKKNGQDCKDCGTIISKMIIGQRSTFYCSNCQK